MDNLTGKVRTAALKLALSVCFGRDVVSALAYKATSLQADQFSRTDTKIQQAPLRGSHCIHCEMRYNNGSVLAGL